MCNSGLIDRPHEFVMVWPQPTFFFSPPKLLTYDDVSRSHNPAASSSPQLATPPSLPNKLIYYSSLHPQAYPRRPMISPAQPPWTPSPHPSQPPFSDLLLASPHQSSKQPIDFSPPLIAMVVIAAAAFLIVTYSRLISRYLSPPLLRQIRRYRRWRRRRRHLLPSSVGGDGSATDSPPYAASDVLYSPYGLDESVIKSMPLSIYSEKNRLKGGAVDDFSGDCAVCLLEFVENDYVRTLPICAHSFHVDCIDIWLRSHATCPLCRAGILPRDWPFIPIMAARIRPSMDEVLLLDSIFLDPHLESTRSESVTAVPEIVPAQIENDMSPATIQSESRPNYMLKRSYSFGYERNFASERLVTTSPWRHNNRRGSFSFWRRPSPFSSLTKHRVFSFRSNRGMKSPFFGRRRSGAFAPLSESASIRYAYYYSSSAAIGAGSSRRSKSMASPMFGRSAAAAFSSSRMRCGDPEALISPERYGR